MKATGKRRKSGPPKGVKCQAKLPGGSRTIKPLAQVYTEENLPALGVAKPGERRNGQAAETATFVESLEGREHIVPRGHGPRAGKSQPQEFATGLQTASS